MVVINCIIFVLAFLYVTYRIGIILNHFIKNENKTQSFLYGFLLLIGINQIILTPCIILHTSFKIAFYIVLVIDLLLLGFSYIIEKPKKLLLKKIRKPNKEDIITIVMCLLISFQIIVTTVSYISNPDDSFYVSLSTASIDSEALYMEEPSMGYEAEQTLLTVTEQIPTYEVQIAIWSKISNINPATMCHSVLPMIVIFISYLAFYNFATTFLNKKSSKIFLIILSIIFIFTGFTTKFRAGCLLLKSWQGKAIFFNVGITMILASLIRMDKKVEKKDIIVLIISNLFSIALTSTAIFLNSFIYMSFGLLKLIKRKWKDILLLIISFIPIIIYVLIYIILTQSGDGAFPVPKNDVNIIDTIKTYKSEAYIAYYVIATIVVMIIGNKTAKTYFVYIQLINLLTIWSPLFSNFIAKYLTSSAIFWRVLWLMPVEFAIAYCIAQIIEKIKNTKIKMLVCILSVIILIIPGKCVYSFEIAENLENIQQPVLDQVNYILEQSKEEEEIIVMTPPEETHGWSMRQISAKIKLVYSRFLYIDKLRDEQEIINRNKINQLYYGEQNLTTIGEFNQLIKDLKIDWLIVDKENINMIEYVKQSCLQKNFEMDGYILYKNDW